LTTNHKGLSPGDSQRRRRRAAPARRTPAARRPRPPCVWLRWARALGLARREVSIRVLRAALEPGRGADQRQPAPVPDSPRRIPASKLADVGDAPRGAGWPAWRWVKLTARVAGT